MVYKRSPARLFWMLAGLVGMLVLVQGTALADITVQGSTSGAFWNGTSNQGSDVASLYFSGNSFGSQSSDLTLNLGSFSIECIICSNTNFQPYDFKLTVNFTIPQGTTGTPVIGDVSGKVKGIFASTENSVGIDFGGPTLFTYSNASGSGQFYLTVNDIAAGSIPVYGDAMLTGSITGATFTPNGGGTDATPEPGSIVLLGTLVGGLGLWMKRRRSA